MIHKCGESIQEPQYADGRVFLSDGETYRYYEAKTKKTEELKDSMLKGFYCWMTVGDYMYGVTAGNNGQPCLIAKEDFYSGKDAFIPLVWDETGDGT